MTIKYRPHKSTLDEAMKHCMIFNTIEEMIQYISSNWTGYTVSIDEDEYIDDRINWYNWHYVMGMDKLGKSYVVGMCDIEDE